MIVFLLVLQFQNCGNIKLATPGEVAESSVLSKGEIVLPAREHNPNQELRFVLLFDMSQSMGFGICPSEIDVLLNNVRPSPNCVKESGADVNGNRFQVSLQWLDDLEKSVVDQKLDPRKIKISVNYFTGGLGEQSLSDVMLVFNNITYSHAPNASFKMTDGQHFTTPFLNLANARLYIYVLWAFHHHHMLNTQGLAYSYDLIPKIQNRAYAAELQRVYALTMLPSTTLTAGTSIPQPSLEKIILNISQELRALKLAEKSADTHFEIVFFSDGVAKPRPAHISKVIDMLWQDSYAFKTPCDQFSPKKYDLSFCSARCGAYRDKMAELGATCDYYSTDIKTNKPCSLSLEDRWSPREGGQCESFRFSFGTCQTCVYYLENFSLNDNPYQGAFDQMRGYWGDWSLNSHLQIVKSFNKLRNVFLLQYPETNFNIHLVRLDSFESLFKISPGELDPNVNWFVKLKELYPTEVAFYLLTQPLKPFSLFNLSAASDRFRIETALAMNLNLRVDNDNQLVVDSDADGVPDSLEGKNGFDAKEARSDGKCLDGIRLKYGACVSVGCDTKLDQDLDGLNECEERTIGSDERNFDKDGDGIPDGIEVIYGLNPLQKDNLLDLNGDGQTNFEQLRMGLMPYAEASQVPSQNKVILELNYMGEQIKGNSRLPTYNIQIDRVPLYLTAGAAESQMIYRAAPYVSQNANPLYLLARNHDPGVNAVLVLLKVSNINRQNDFSWYYSTQALRSKTQDKLNLDFSVFKKK